MSGCVRVNKIMSRKSAISAIERGALSELCHALEILRWDIRSEPLNRKSQSALHIACTCGHLHIIVEYLVIECESVRCLWADTIVFCCRILIPLY